MQSCVQAALEAGKKKKKKNQSWLYGEHLITYLVWARKPSLGSLIKIRVWVTAPQILKGCWEKNLLLTTLWFIVYKELCAWGRGRTWIVNTHQGSPNPQCHHRTDISVSTRIHGSSESSWKALERKMSMEDVEKESARIRARETGRGWDQGSLLTHYG